MKRPEGSDPDDELRKLLEGFEREFGHRPPEDPARRPAARSGWSYARSEPPRDAEPMGPLRQARGVRLRLPAHTPRVVYALLAVNVLMYAVTLVFTALRDGTVIPPFDDPFSTVLYQLGAKYGPAIDAGQYWRFLTPIMLHGGLLHLGFNSYALYALGPETERIYGSGRFFAIYVLAGLAGSIASYVRSPSLSIGASGAIFGLIGALAAFFYSARSLIGAEASRQQVQQLIAMAAINIVLGFAVEAIDNAAHIGGLVAGGLAGFALAPRYAIDDRLYPPVVVRADRPAVSWLMGAVMLAVLILIAVIAVGSRG